MRKIFLNTARKTKYTPLGLYATVDDDMYDLLSTYTWHVAKRKNDSLMYAMTSNFNGRYALMHRVILGIVEDKNKLADHSDGNGLNNTLKNLRVCTASENSRNRRPAKYKTSKYMGVWVEKKRPDKFRVRIRFGGKEKNVGWFETETEAALAYNKAAQEYHGEFARLNIIE